MTGSLNPLIDNITQVQCQVLGLQGLVKFTKTEESHLSTSVGFSRGTRPGSFSTGKSYGTTNSSVLETLISGDRYIRYIPFRRTRGEPRRDDDPRDVRPRDTGPRDLYKEFNPDDLSPVGSVHSRPSPVLSSFPECPGGPSRHVPSTGYCPPYDRTDGRW